jgi:hypothetical protein
VGTAEGDPVSTSQEWLARHHFAEYAEALRLSTDEIFHVICLSTETFSVLHTKDYDAETLYHAVLERDADRILRVKCSVPIGTGEDVRRLMNEARKAAAGPAEE